MMLVVLGLVLALAVHAGMLFFGTQIGGSQPDNSNSPYIGL
jgi:hypothetical protein